jgi:hypothetical protein
MYSLRLAVIAALRREPAAIATTDAGAVSRAGAD